MARRLAVIDILGLSAEHVQEPNHAPNLHRLTKEGHPITVQPILPAVSAPIQTSLLTGCYPNQHGIGANGFFD